MLRMMTNSMFVMGLVTAPVVLSPRQAPAPAPDYRTDPRLETLRTFFRNAAYPQSDGSWKAGSGAVFDLRSNQLRPETWTSADAAGLPILPGLVRYDEVLRSEEHTS